MDQRAGIDLRVFRTPAASCGSDDVRTYRMGGEHS
jgi:hypothetical protein